jgi:hypothetical protein
MVKGVMIIRNEHFKCEFSVNALTELVFLDYSLRNKAKCVSSSKFYSFLSRATESVLELAVFFVV